MSTKGTRKRKADENEGEANSKAARHDAATATPVSALASLAPTPSLAPTHALYAAPVVAIPAPLSIIPAHVPLPIHATSAGAAATAATASVPFAPAEPVHTNVCGPVAPPVQQAIMVGAASAVKGLLSSTAAASVSAARKAMGASAASKKKYAHIRPRHSARFF